MHYDAAHEHGNGTLPASIHSLCASQDHDMERCRLVGCLHSPSLFPPNYFGRLPYKTYFGGVSALSPEQYMKMNGFPNTYWGWGGEDDDIAVR